MLDSPPQDFDGENLKPWKRAADPLLRGKTGGGHFRTVVSNRGSFLTPPLGHLTTFGDALGTSQGQRPGTLPSSRQCRAQCHPHRIVWSKDISRAELEWSCLEVSENHILSSNRECLNIREEKLLWKIQKVGPPCLLFHRLGGWARRITMGSRPAWATRWAPVSLE